MAKNIVNKSVERYFEAEQYNRIGWARVKGFTVGTNKPLKISRIHDANAEINCYITDKVLQLCQMGKLNIDDVVLIQFMDRDPKKAVVVDKVHCAHP